jgi:molybdopterin biosynthesis enzyme
MAAASDTRQTITRLTPLAEVLALIDQETRPVTPRTLDVAAAGGRTLATDAVAPARPTSALALIDGWAVAADLTLDAGGYAPALLPEPPSRVEAGQPVPAGADSVAPLDAVRVTQSGAEALATINPGDGVLPAGGDCDPAIPLGRAGERLRAVDLAAFAAAGIARVTVREPRIRVVPLRGSAIVMAAARLIAGDIARRGGAVRVDDGGRDFSTVLAADSADAVIAIGGTGAGRNDANVSTLSREGRLAVHGIALTPGETAALGFADARPVLLLPGRLDAALAVWLTIGRQLLDRLAGTTSAKAAEPAHSQPLARKVTSTVGLAELIPVRRSVDEPDKVEPLAAKYLPFSALSRSEGWILVPAESEGYSAGTAVWVRPWP